MDKTKIKEITIIFGVVVLFFLIIFIIERNENKKQDKSK